jgi:hypothetical protein
VILEVIKDLGSQWPENAQIALVQATSPFVDPATIKECLAIAAKSKVGFSAASTHRFLWQKENTWNPEETTADSTTEVTTEEVTSLFKCKKLCNNNPRVSHYGWGVDPDTDRVIYFKVLECKCTSGHLMEGERRTGDKTTPYANNEFGDLISHQSYGTAPPPAHTDSHGPCNH